MALFEVVVAVILEISHYEKKSTPEALIEGTPLSGIWPSKNFLKFEEEILKLQLISIVIIFRFFIYFLAYFVWLLLVPYPTNVNLFPLFWVFLDLSSPMYIIKFDKWMN